MIISQAASGKIEHFDRVGYVMICTSFISAILMFYVNRMVGSMIEKNKATKSSGEDGVLSHG